MKNLFLLLSMFTFVGLSNSYAQCSKSVTTKTVSTTATKSCCAKSKTTVTKSVTSTGCTKSRVTVTKSRETRINRPSRRALAITPMALIREDDPRIIPVNRRR